METKSPRSFTLKPKQTSANQRCRIGIEFKGSREFSMTVNLGYPLMHINEVSFMYSWEGPLEEEMATHSSIFG